MQPDRELGLVQYVWHGKLWRAAIRIAFHARSLPKIKLPMQLSPARASLGKHWVKHVAKNANQCNHQLKPQETQTTAIQHGDHRVWRSNRKIAEIVRVYLLLLLHSKLKETPYRKYIHGWPQQDVASNRRHTQAKCALQAAPTLTDPSYKVHIVLLSLRCPIWWRCCLVAVIWPTICSVTGCARQQQVHTSIRSSMERACCQEYAYWFKVWHVFSLVSRPPYVWCTIQVPDHNLKNRQSAWIYASCQHRELLSWYSILSLLNLITLVTRRIEQQRGSLQALQACK